MPEADAEGRRRIMNALTAIRLRAIQWLVLGGARAARAGEEDPGGGDAGLNRVRYRYRLLSLTWVNVRNEADLWSKRLLFLDTRLHLDT